jgi:DNA-binding NarL/FixJ family response regulator
MSLPPTASIRILLVDDHAIVRAGYRLLLQNTPEIEIVAEADSGEAACQEFARTAPDVVVMDLSLPGMGGLAAIRRIVARAARARVLVFSVHEEPVFAEKALAAGARGYLTKSSAPEHLVQAIKAIAAGGIHVEPRIAQHLAFHKSRGEETPFAVLTVREFEICCLMAEGVGIPDVARRLALSTKTVANYATQIKNKLGIASNGELIRLAIRHGIISV